MLDGIAEAASVAGTIARSDTEVGLRTTVSDAAATRSSTTTGEAAPSWSAAHWAPPGRHRWGARRTHRSGRPRRAAAPRGGQPEHPSANGPLNHVNPPHDAVPAVDHRLGTPDDWIAALFGKSHFWWRVAESVSENEEVYRSDG